MTSQNYYTPNEAAKYLADAVINMPSDPQTRRTSTFQPLSLANARMLQSYNVIVSVSTKDQA